MNPIVSVIIPIYNSLQYIKECVDSVVSQSYKDLEIILIDDGSFDGSYEFILNNYSLIKNIKILTHINRQNKGVVESRRLGVKNAQGEYLVFLDSDDVFEFDKIENQVKIILNNPDVVLVHSKIKFINELKYDSFYYDFSFGEIDLKYELNLKEFINVNHICNSTVMVRKDLFLKIKFTSNLAFQYEDWIQWTMLADFGKFYYMNNPTCKYRYHTGSSTAILNRNGKTSLYANFEKNIILEEAFRGKTQHTLVLDGLQKSLNDIYQNLFYKNDAPVMIFNQAGYFKFSFKIYQFLKHFIGYFNR